MKNSVTFYQDQGQVHQIQGPIALEAGTPKIDAALQLMVYLQLEVTVNDFYILHDNFYNFL
jgi:hypothetical protein